MAGGRLDPTDGFGEQGGSYTSHGVVHESEVVRLPEDVDSAVASLGAVGAIAYQGVAVSEIRPGSRVLVAGLGAVGQFSALLSRLRGSAGPWAIDPVAERCELATRVAHATPLDPSEDLAAQIEASAWGVRPWRGRNERPRSRYEQLRWAGAEAPLDVVIDATGRDDAIDAYLPLLAREGSLCLQGYFPRPLHLDFHAAHLKRIAVHRAQAAWTFSTTRRCCGFSSSSTSARSSAWRSRSPRRRPRLHRALRSPVRGHRSGRPLAGSAVEAQGRDTGGGDLARERR